MSPGGSGDDDTRSNLGVAAERCDPGSNGRSWAVGELETPTLAELRARAQSAAGRMRGALGVSCVVPTSDFIGIPPTATPSFRWRSLNAARSTSHAVYLSELGGGAFGNRPDWIHGAMRRALDAVRELTLDVRLASYRAPSPGLAALEDSSVSSR